MFNSDTPMEVYLRKPNSERLIAWVSYDNCKMDVCKLIGCYENEAAVIEILPGIIMVFSQLQNNVHNFTLPNGYSIHGTVAFFKRNGNSFAELSVYQHKEIDNFINSL